MHKFEAVTKRFNVLDHAMLGMCVIDKEYTVLFWNSCLEKWTGIESADILGIDIRSLLYNFKRGITAQPHPSACAAQPYSLLNYLYPSQYQTKGYI